MPTFRLKPLPGFEPIERFLKAFPEMPSQQVRRWHVDTSFRENHVAVENQQGAGLFVKQCEALRDVFKDRPYARCTKIAVVGNNQWSIYYNSPDPLTAEIMIDRLELSPGTDPVVIVDVIAQNFALLPPSEVSFANLPQVQQNQLRAYETSLSDMKEQVAELGKTVGAIAEQQAEFLRRQTEEMAATLDTERKKLRDEQESRTKRFEEDRSAFEERVKQLDLQEHKTARRSIAKSTRDAIKQLKEEKSRAVANYFESMVHILSLIILFGSGIGIALFVQEIIGKGNAAASSYVPLIGLSVIGGSTLFFYLRYLSIWAERSRLYDRNKEKYSVDFNRADWLTELVFEYAEQKKEFPAELMNRLSQGLFSDMSWSKQNIHPAEDILEFVKRIGKIKVDKDGAAVEMKESDSKKS